MSYFDEIEMCEPDIWEPNCKRVVRGKKEARMTEGREPEKKGLAILPL